MSKQSRERESAIDQEFDSTVKNAQNTVSNLVKHTAAAKLFFTFIHDNLLNNKGDLSQGDRKDLRAALTPLYPQIQASLAEITAIFNIYNDDLTVWQANFDAYLLANPTILDEALNRFPKVV